MPNREDGRIDRRTVLKGIGLGAVSAGAATGLASAHHVADLAVECNNPDEFPQGSIVAGDSFNATIHFQSGHGSEACFTAAISKDGSNWTQVGQKTVSGLNLGQHVHTQLNSTIPVDTAGGSYTWRVSATEKPVPGQFCPHPGETSASRSFVKHHDCALEIVPPVEVHDVSFRGCSEVWVAFDAFPVSSTSAQVNVNGNWRSITINKSDLTKIPGQYGDRDVFKYSVSGNDKIVGFKIVGNTYENDHRCAQNV